MDDFLFVSHAHKKTDRDTIGRETDKVSRLFTTRLILCLFTNIILFISVVLTNIAVICCAKSIFQRASVSFTSLQKRRCLGLVISHVSEVEHLHELYSHYPTLLMSL